MDIFWLLLLAHFIADYTLQTNYVAAWKRRNHQGLSFHVATHVLITIILLWPYLNDYWVETPRLRLTGWACVVIIHFIHFLEDFWRSWSVVKRGAPDNLLFYVWDQVIHIITLYAVSPVGVPIISNRWILLAILIVIVTHFATVTIYFIEKEFQPQNGFPETLEKYGAILGRLAAFGCFFLPGWWWLTVFAVLVAQFYLAQKIAPLRLSRSAFVLGSVLVLAAGWFGRSLFIPI